MTSGVKFIHLTDLHLVPRGETLYGHDTVARTRAAVSSIARDHRDAAFVAITGDLAERGEAAAYESLASLLQDLPMPVHLTIGNHDDRDTFLAVFRDVPRTTDGFVSYVAETPAGPAVVLDTVDTGRSGGRLCERRLDWLSGQLSALRGEDVLVFMHHPPFDVGIGSMDRRGLDGRDALHECLAAHGRVRHIFFGHIHRSISGLWRGIAFSGQRGTHHQVALVLAPGERTDACFEPPAYSVVLVSHDQVTVHVAHYDDDSPRFDLRDRRLMAAQSPAELFRLAAGEPGTA